LYKPLIQAVQRTEKLVTSAIFKKYLHCLLAARILTMNFFVCTLAVKKKNQDRFRPVGSDHSLVSSRLVYFPERSGNDFVLRFTDYDSEIQAIVFQ
jgi:hypothetical protein